MLQDTRHSDIESDIADHNLNNRYPPLNTSPPATSTAASTPGLPPLRTSITAYRLLNIGALLGLGIPKAVYSSKGQSVIAGDLDWAGGLFAAVVYVRPRHVELAPTLISFLYLLACISLAFMKTRRTCPGPSGSFTETYPVPLWTSSRVRESFFSMRVLTNVFFR